MCFRNCHFETSSGDCSLSHPVTQKSTLMECFRDEVIEELERLREIVTKINDEIPEEVSSFTHDIEFSEFIQKITNIIGDYEANRG